MLVVKNLPASAGDARDKRLIPGWGRSRGEGNGNPLWNSCLENSMDRGACWATVHKVAKSRTQLKGLITHACIYKIDNQQGPTAQHSTQHSVIT